MSNDVNTCKKCRCLFYRENGKSKICWNCELGLKDGRSIEIK